MVSVQTGLAFRSQYLENDIKTCGFGNVTTNLKTCRGLGLKIMNSVYFQKSYKTNLLKTLHQTGFEAAPRLENHEDRTFEYIYIYIYHERNLLKKKHRPDSKPPPGLRIMKSVYVKGIIKEMY